MNSKLPIIVSIILLSAVLVAVTPAVAVPNDLPDQAKANPPPFRVQILEHDGLQAVAKPVYTTLDDPAIHVTPAGTFDGVGLVVIASPDSPTGDFGCTGTLLNTGKHVLSAAHCFSNSNGVPNWTGGIVDFGSVTENIVSVTIHPDWNGDLFAGNDIAVAELENEITTITGYDLDRNSKDDTGTVTTKVGYGVSGFLATGEDDLNYPFGTKRDIQNKYDDYADTMLKALGLKNGRDFVRQSVLQYDGDDGNILHDAFGFFFNNFDLGLGTQEGNSAGGDSGGPSFTNINGEYFVTSVTSYGLTLSFVGGATSDCHINLVEIEPDVFVNVPDSSCGEFAADTSVAKYASFVDSITGGGDSGTGDEPNCPPKSKSPKCS